MSHFIPPLFSKFGKATNDIINQKIDAKKDDFKHQASVKSQSNGVVITSSAVASNTIDKLDGKVNVRYDDKRFGDVTVEYVTTGKVKVTNKLSKLQKGVVVNSEVVLDKAVSGKVGAEYVDESVAATIEYSQKKSKNVLGSIALGYDGFSVGAAVNADVEKIQNGSDAAYNLDFGAQYEDGNLTAAGIVEANNTISLSVFHRVSSDLQLASKYIVTANQGNSLALGAQYKVNPATVVKGKTLIFQDKTYAVAGYVQHKLENPNVTIGIANQWHSVDDKKSGFGVSLAFGDN